MNDGNDLWYANEEVKVEYEDRQTDQQDWNRSSGCYRSFQGHLLDAPALTHADSGTTYYVLLDPSLYGGILFRKSIETCGALY